MTPEEIEKLEALITAELNEAIKKRSLIDEQIERLRDDRKQTELVIAAGRAMLKFAATAKEATRGTSPKHPPIESGAASTPALPAGPTAGVPSHEALPPLPDILEALNVPPP